MGEGCWPLQPSGTLTCTGQAAPSPRAQMVCPSICLLISQSASISAACASPRTNRAITLFIQSTPAGIGMGMGPCSALPCSPPAPQPRPLLTFPARGALPTALVFVELDQARNGFDDVGLGREGG